MSATIYFLFLVSYAMADQTEQQDFMQRLLGTKGLQIGFGEDCYLVSYEPTKERQGTRFECKRKEGSKIEIEMGLEKDHYRFKVNDKDYWYWKGQKGNVKPLQFRPNRKKGPNEFWIRQIEDGRYSFGVNREGGECPLYWKDTGDERKFPAEFRCNSPIEKTFWIKGQECVAKSITPVETGENDAVVVADDIVGVVTGGICSNSASNYLTLSETTEMSDEITIETSESKEINWGLSASVTFEASAKFLGTGASTEISTTGSVGGSEILTSGRATSNSKTTVKGSSSQVNYNTPGAAIVLGFRKEYKFNSDVPAKVTAQCKNGHQFIYDTTMLLKSTLYGITSFSSDVVEFKPRQCKEEYLECLRAQDFKSYKAVTAAKEAFMECFPVDSIKIKKKKKIGMERESSSKSKNKDSSKSTDKTL